MRYLADSNLLSELRKINNDRKAAEWIANLPVDILLAALAQEHKLAVATRDTDPFVGTGVPTFNPWTGERFNGA